MIKLYQIITNLALPLIRVYLFIRKLRGKEDKVRFQERLGKASIDRPQGFLIWVHAASVGESLSILPVIESLNKSLQNIHFLITTGTTSSANLINSKLPNKTIHQYIPVDRIPYVKEFLNHWQPNLALWVESEFWPNLIWQTKHYCPLILVNGRVSDKSFITWQKYKKIIRIILSSFSLCLAQSKQDMERLLYLGANNVKYYGNIKYDAKPLAYDQAKLAEFKKIIGNRAVFIAASTHAGEEDIIAKTHKKLKSEYPNLLTILIPRHPKRKDEIIHQILTYNLIVKIRSENNIIDNKTDIYLADTIGEMGIFYRLGEIVFIGGSLIKHGGQNPLEPARIGVAIITGPYTFNFAEIITEFRNANAIIEIANENALYDTIKLLLSNKQKLEEMKTNALNLVEEKNGIIGKICEEIKNYMNGK